MSSTSPATTTAASIYTKLISISANFSKNNSASSDPSPKQKSSPSKIQCSPRKPFNCAPDRTKLGRVIVNLLGNAIKFTEAGRVVVRALVLPTANNDAHNSRELRITISDTGIGIPPQFVSRIFDEFFQIKNPARDRNKGAGLGLAICKRLVDAMGGKLSAQSELGIGTTFIVTLPGSMIRDEFSPAIAPHNPGQTASSSKTQRLEGLKILLVEDHHATAVFAGSALLGNEGAAVDEAHDGTTGLQLLGRSLSNGAPPYDALLLDLMLPDMDGDASILQWLQSKTPTRLALRPRSHRRCVVTDRVAQILRLGLADCLLHKPIDIEALVSFLEARSSRD